MTNQKTNQTTIHPVDEVITQEHPEEQIRKLEAQILQLRRLHANALQMLVIMGRNLLKNQQIMLNTIAEMRTQYQTFAEFIKENSAHLPDPPVAENDNSIE